MISGFIRLAAAVPLICGMLGAVAAPRPAHAIALFDGKLDSVLTLIRFTDDLGNTIAAPNGVTVAADPCACAPYTDQFGTGTADTAGHALGSSVAMQPGDATLAQMVASTERGLLVNRFWYANVAEPSRAVITGMTRDGLFLVEKGRLAGPVCNMRFTESIINALSRVEMVGSDLHSVGDEWGSGVTRVPALKLSSFRFTGVTEF